MAPNNEIIRVQYTTTQCCVTQNIPSNVAKQVTTVE